MGNRNSYERILVSKTPRRCAREPWQITGVSSFRNRAIDEG